MWPLVATCSRGFEEVLADELKAIAASTVAAGRGIVSFPGGMDTVLATNLYLRSAMRILVSLARGRVDNRDQLYGLAASVPWEDVLAQRQTFAE